MGWVEDLWVGCLCHCDTVDYLMLGWREAVIVGKLVSDLFDVVVGCGGLFQ